MINGFLQTGKASVIIDGQFGSTGKGLIAAYATEGGNYPHIATTNASANAGHTTQYRDGTKILCYHLPTIGVRARQTGAPTIIYLNAGSIIDFDVLRSECEQNDIPLKDVIIHPRAAVIMPEDKEYEGRDGSAQTKLASTRKGVGRALARKVMRESQTAAAYAGTGITVAVMDLNHELARGASVSVEVPQGMSLSINHGLAYPHCTSRDVSLGQALADANIHPSFLGPVIMTCRTYPIRAGHVFLPGQMGQIGDSGPCFPGQREIDWSEIGVDPELTTVTKRPRRIFTWSNTQYEQALRAARPDLVFLNFVNYCKDVTEFDDLLWRMRAAEALVGKPTQKVFGYGPNVENITPDPGLARKMVRESLNAKV